MLTEFSGCANRSAQPTRWFRPFSGLHTPAMVLPSYESSERAITTPALLASGVNGLPESSGGEPVGSEVVLASGDELSDPMSSPSDRRLVAQEAAVGPPVTDITSAEVNVDIANYAGTMTLAELEAIAFANNPTIQELVATTQKGAGYRFQVGLRANPTLGYQAMQLADQGTDQHTAFVEQEFVTGDKLALNRQVLNEAVRSQLFELETQKMRVATDVRIKFYEALASQERLRLIREFRNVTNKGLELAELRLKAQEGTRIDLLQAKVQKNEIELAMRQAEIALEANWRELSAITGSALLPQLTLAGELPSSEVSNDWTELRASMVSMSPEYQAAQARISQARANLRRQGVQAIPNITAQIAAGVDNATDSGMINLQVGAPIPVFNKNQGNIAAARAEYCRAVLDATRIEKAMQERLARVSNSFDAALQAVTTYTSDILPSAEESLELAEVAYRAGETSFIQVLIARRTFFDANLQLLQAQSQLAQARSQIDGFVLTGSLEPVRDDSGDDSLRGLTFSQQ